jgi:hypothetical protein
MVNRVPIEIHLHHLVSREDGYDEYAIFPKDDWTLERTVWINF